MKFVKKLDSFLLEHVITKRPPNFTIPYSVNKTYMQRWFIIPHNRIFNIYLHQYTEPDPDYTLHDHPWFSVSLILFSGYVEQTILYGGRFKYKELRQGDLHFMSPWHTHRICQVRCGICRTLFITGPILRKWGFHNSITGWVNSKTHSARQKRIGKEF